MGESFQSCASFDFLGVKGTVMVDLGCTPEVKEIESAGRDPGGVLYYDEYATGFLDAAHEVWTAVKENAKDRQIKGVGWRLSGAK